MLYLVFFFPVNGEIPPCNSMDVGNLLNHVNIALYDCFLYRIFFSLFLHLTNLRILCIFSLCTSIRHLKLVSIYKMNHEAMEYSLGVQFCERSRI